MGKRVSAGKTLSEHDCAKKREGKKKGTDSNRDANSRIGAAPRFWFHMSPNFES
jgi:hypothetical protein